MRVKKLYGMKKRKMNELTRLRWLRVYTKLQSGFWLDDQSLCSET
jgi:hypothetical protein